MAVDTHIFSNPDDDRLMMISQNGNHQLHAGEHLGILSCHQIEALTITEERRSSWSLLKANEQKKKGLQAMVTMRAEKMISPGKKALASLIGMFLRRRPLVKDDTSCSVAAAVYRKSYNENSVQLWSWSQTMIYHPCKSIILNVLLHLNPDCLFAGYNSVTLSCHLLALLGVRSKTEMFTIITELDDGPHNSHIVPTPLFSTDFIFIQAA